MKARELPEEIYKYKEEWVALSFEDKFLGHGKTPELCIEDSKRNGHWQYILMFVPTHWPMIHGSSLHIWNVLETDVE